MNAHSSKKKVLILGGGFGGIEAARELARRDQKRGTRSIFSITLVSDKHHFEYTPALYRVVTGKSPLEVCIPLSDIFEDFKVDISIDTVSEISLKERTVTGTSGSRYQYDYLVVALGSQPAYFGISGLDQYALSFKTISQALALKRHLHSIIDEHTHLPKNETERALHIDVVGAGAAGVELAGELSGYLKTLAKNHDLDPKEIKIDIIEAGPRLLPSMPESVSQKAGVRLKELGIRIMVNTKVLSHDGKIITYNDGAMPSKTLVWTAGVKPHALYGQTVGWELAKNGRVIVDEFLRAHGAEKVFVIGDGAQTPYSGTAQTALHDGITVARAIAEYEKFGVPHTPYHPDPSAYVIPVGPGWGIFSFRGFVFSGRVVWWLRELIELDFFGSILSFGKAWRAWRDGQQVCESCATCEAEIAKTS